MQTDIGTDHVRLDYLPDDRDDYIKYKQFNAQSDLAGDQRTDAPRDQDRSDTEDRENIQESNEECPHRRIGDADDRQADTQFNESDA